jgi:hypothetical protein
MLAIHGPDTPRSTIYDGKRMFLGRKDLVVSFYTQKCQFKCSYCALPMRSANVPVAAADLDAQIAQVFEKYQAELTSFQSFSFGNEGSALDRARFHPQSMHFLLERAREMTSLEVLSIETRPEYLRAPVLEDVLSRTHAGPTSPSGSRRRTITSGSVSSTSESPSACSRSGSRSWARSASVSPRT